MKKLFLLIIINFILAGNTKSQSFENLVRLQKPVLFEKLYVSVDRDFYSQGDIIWLKVFHVNGYTHQLNLNYRNIYAQLIAENRKIVGNLMMFSKEGMTNGEFNTDTLSNGNYTIRVYTKYLENFGENAFYQKNIRISKTFEADYINSKLQEENIKISVDFLPEGGNMVANAANNIAFKAINEKGKGVFVSGKIVDDNGDTILHFSTTYKGMGKFLIMPKSDRSYFALIDQKPELKISLPEAKLNGICLKYKEIEESTVFEFSSNLLKIFDAPFHFVASHKGIVLSSEKLKMSSTNQTLVVEKSLFPSGISKITLLDTLQNIISERLIFVENELQKEADIDVNKKIFRYRDSVRIDFDVAKMSEDSINSTMLVSVVNRRYFCEGENSQNIKSYLLLDSDLKGVIESPASYFYDEENINSSEKLDLLMLVNGWRNYLWEDIQRTSIKSIAEWNDAGINVSGYVKKLLWNSPVPEAEISMDYMSRRFQIGKTTADDNGRFNFVNMYVLENMRVMLNARTKNGSNNTEIILDPLPVKITEISFENTAMKIDLDSDFINKNGSLDFEENPFNPAGKRIILESIDIIKDKNNAIIRSFGAYPWADRTLTITRNDYTFYNLIDYLKYTLPSLTDNGDEILLKNKPVDFMIDGIESTYTFNEIRTIQMNEIATIDILNPGFRSGFSIGTLGVVNENGLIAIYKKDVPDIMQSDIYVKGRIMPKIRGYSLPRKFYTPEYSLENIKSPLFDERATLYWNPEVKVLNGKASVDFFTSDEKGEYLIYIEGITQNGKIVFGSSGFEVQN